MFKEFIYIFLITFIGKAQAEGELQKTIWQPLSVSFVLIVLLPFVVALSLGFDYVSRGIIFWVSDKQTRIRRENIRFSETLSDLKRHYGADAVDRAFRDYRHFYEKDGLSNNLESFQAFHFFKYWLRSRYPPLAVDFLEFEITLMLGLVIPMAVLSGLLLFARQKYIPSAPCLLAALQIFVASRPAFCRTSLRKSK